MPDVVVDMKRLKRFSREIEHGLRSTTPGPMRRVMNQWAAIYRAFILQRFVAQSRGGGWPPLAKSTLRRRRKPAKVRVAHRTSRRRASAHGGLGVAILIDNEMLIGALQPNIIGVPGALEQQIPFGIRVGYGGPARYPGSKASIAEIASYHQEGAGRLPKREIIVMPTVKLAARMASLLVRKLQDMANGRG